MATDILQAFDEFRSRLELNQSFQDAISTHHNAVRQWIESYDSNIKTRLIGSLQRKTRIQPRGEDIFDIDILIILGGFNRWVQSGGISPADALERLENVVSQNETYERMGPETDSPAIIVEYSDNMKVELIPAYNDNIGQAPDGTPTLPKGRGYWIPKNNRWAIADYDYDAEHISEANQNSNGYLIPSIKMLKAAKRNLFPEMKSYHLEVLATDIIPGVVAYYKNQGFQISYPSLIFSFFSMAKDEVLKSCKIPHSKSPCADEYMNSYEKDNLADKFTRITNYFQPVVQLDGRDGIENWQNLFGRPFPSYG